MQLAPNVVEINLKTFSGIGLKIDSIFEIDFDNRFRETIFTMRKSVLEIDMTIDFENHLSQPILEIDLDS